MLRVGFGLLWVLDGILQAQPQMPGGLPSQVIQPAAQSSPGWVQDIVGVGGSLWSSHPIELAAASVWIQVGIGLWLLVAVRGPWSRAAGLTSLAWGFAVWVWGESFGGIFAPGLSWLTGAPGSALLYAVAGALIGRPVAAWSTRRTGRLLLAGTGLFFIGMAVLQAWPGRGFWQGAIHGQPGPLGGMISQMAQLSQPHVLKRIVSAFGSFDVAHGFAVNLFAVIALAVIGAALLSRRRRVVLVAVIAAGAACLAVWVLIQDLGVFGGVGTDPNSMIPIVILLAAGYLGLARVPVASPASPEAGETGERAPAWPERLRGRVAATTLSTAAALGAVAVVMIGVAPASLAALNGTADPIVAETVSGFAPPTDTPAPGFQLTDTSGRPVTLASLRGKVVLMTFLDPVCTSDCPIIAQELKLTAELLGGQERDVEIVAIASNPSYYGTEFTRAFDEQEGMTTVPDWLYLTGSLAQLSRVWGQYGASITNLPARDDHAPRPGDRDRPRGQHRPGSQRRSRPRHVHDPDVVLRAVRR